MLNHKKLHFAFALFTFIGLPYFSLAQYNCMHTKQQFSLQSSSSINNNAKSDTFDLLHYDLELDLTAINQGQFKAQAEITFLPKLAGANRLNLDLLELQVDSVWLNDLNGQNLPISYQYNDSLLQIDINQSTQVGDSLRLTVNYQGTPQMDASGWGGVHRGQGYYYNLGVGFAANPHTFGRAWFPCYDNFVEKSTYRLAVKSVLPLKPFLSGDSISVSTVNGDTILSLSELNQPIPTYLVSFALANYQFLNDTINGLNGPVDIILAAKAADTANLRASFRNLKPIFKAFEHYFGPYHWPKVGYAATTVGAMEHATSIHYPISLIDGSLAGEDIIAHELAHHWFGNLVTCRTADDMWFNEGLAEYCSHLYREYVYGPEQYAAVVRENAWNVLNIAASRDGQQHRPLFAPPHEYVYGYHVYQKGAMVGHNLRNQLGDSLFFGTLKQVFQQEMWGNLSSQEFRDKLIQLTRKQDLQDFWQDWVFQPGYPQFSINNWDYDSSQQSLNLEIKQRLFAAPDYFYSVPVPVSIFGSNGELETRWLAVSDSISSFQQLSLNFRPEAVLAGYHPGLMTATGMDQWNIVDQSNFTNTYSGINGTVETFRDTGAIILMQHLVPAQKQASNNFDFRLSKERYFTVQKLGLKQSIVSAELRFDGSSRGREQALLSSGNDSLVVLYREKGRDQWNIYPHQTKIVSSPNSRLGSFRLTPLLSGDYVLANTAESLSLEPIGPSNQQITIAPNPASQILHIDLKEAEKLQLKIYEQNGKERLQIDQGSTTDSASHKIDVSSLESGFYILEINSQRFKLIIR